MGIRFEDGSSVETNDWDRMKSIVTQRARDGKSKPVEIQQSGVKIKVDKLESKKSKIEAEHSKYIESKYKEWKIRVWRIEADQVYGCNYYQGENVGYAEVPFSDVKDENGVFKYAISIIQNNYE